MKLQYTGTWYIRPWSTKLVYVIFDLGSEKLVKVEHIPVYGIFDLGNKKLVKVEHTGTGIFDLGRIYWYMVSSTLLMKN